MFQMRGFFVPLISVLFLWVAASAEYLIGVGKAEVTGPAAQTLAMGYGRADQELNGIHTRLWARAFLIAHPTEQRQQFLMLFQKMLTMADACSERIVYVSLEAGMASQAVSMAVIERLKVCDWTRCASSAQACVIRKSMVTCTLKRTWLSIPRTRIQPLEAISSIFYIV